MYLVYRTEERYRLGSDPRDNHRYYDGHHNVYVGIHDDPRAARDDAATREDNEGIEYRIMMRLGIPLRMRAAINCGQEFNPSPMERADCQI